MIKLVQIRTALTLVVLMLLSSILPGCLETGDELEEEVIPYAAPKEAMGMWWPTVDGIIEVPILSPNTEWSDGDLKDIKFKDSSKGEHPATLRYKSVEEGMALAVEIDDIEETPQKIVVTFPDRQLTTEITTESDAFLPKFEVDCQIFAFDCPAGENEKVIDESQIFDESLLSFLALNKIASIHDLDDDNLVMEASAKQLFDDTTEVSYTITIWFEQSIWTYTTIVDFDWVLPFLFPRSDISITGIEVTQAIQTADMEMRLVEGKTSLARVYIDSGSLATANVEVTLKFCIFIFCVDELTKTHVAVQNPDRTDFSHSANFVLPDHWVTHEGIDEPFPIGLIASIKPSYPTGAIDYLDPDTSNNYDVGVFWFNSTHDMNIYYVPLTRSSSVPSNANLNTAMSNFELVVPTNPNWNVLATDVIGSTDGMTGDEIAVAGMELIPGLAFLAALTGGGFALPDQIWLAGGFTIPMGGGKVLLGTSTPGWSSDFEDLLHSFSVYSCVSGSANCLYENVLVHEMNHNFGPLGGIFCSSFFDDNENGQWDGEPTDTCDVWEEWGYDLDGEHWGGHIGGCGAGSDDLDWVATYGTDRSIQDIGWAYSVPNPETNPDALIPSSYPDYQSYCNNGDWGIPGGATTPVGNWVSTYRWEKTYDAFLDWEIGNPSGRQSPTSSTTIFTVVTVNEDGTGSIDYTYERDGSFNELTNHRSGNTSNSPFSLVAKNSNGGILEEFAIDPEFENEPNGTLYEADFGPSRTYIFSMPGNSQIDSIALSHKNSRGIQITLDEVTSADSVPTIRMQSISGDTGSRTTSFNLSWTSAQTSSNREVLYQLEYSWSPEIWLPIGTPTNLTSVSMDMSTLPGGNDSKFRVRAMHGLSTYYSESTPFSVLNQAPELTLETSGALSLAPFKGRLNEVTQGDSFSITPSITDADWTSLNRDGFSAVLKQDGEIVWDAANEPKNRIGVQGSSFSAPKISLDMGVAVPEVCSLAAPFVPGGAVLSLVGGTMCSFNFPNSQLLPGEMTPGDYEFEMTYVDVGGASVTETVSFSIIVPDFLVGPDSTSSAEDVLQEYRSNLQSRAPIDLQDDLSRDELQYYVELERAARGDEDALSDTEISDLQYLYHISDSRANELQEEVAAGTKDGDGQ